MKEIHAEVKTRYYRPRIHAELVARGHDCCVNTVARAMREAGIAAKTKRKFRQPTDPYHSYPVAENVLDRDFDPDQPNTSWVADVTYIGTHAKCRPIRTPTAATSSDQARTWATVGRPDIARPAPSPGEG